VHITRNTIAAIGVGECPGPPDLRADWLTPGFIDIHVHCGGGHDLSRSAEDLAAGLSFHRAHGTTSALSPLVTAPIERLCAELSIIAAMERPAAARAPRRLMLVTDAISAAGNPDGDYNLGSLPVRVEHGQAYLVATGALAGSTLTMARAVHCAVTDVDQAPRQASDTATLHPARLLGLQERAGALAPGRRADLLALDRELRIESVFASGTRLPAGPSPHRPEEANG
jgi:N-acetylglucosamine-6-phosphate deacetylase